MPFTGFGQILKLIKLGHNEEARKSWNKRKHIFYYVAWILESLCFPILTCLAGVPSRQLSLGQHRRNNLYSICDRVLGASDVVGDNHFYDAYICGRYRKTNCPRYLTPDGFAKLQSALRENRLVLVCDTLQHALESSKFDKSARDGSPFTVASLLDHMDWMEHKDVLEEMRTLLPRMDISRSRVFWRSYSERVSSPVLSWLKPRRIDDSDDRLGMYWSTWMADLSQLQPGFVESRLLARLNPIDGTLAGRDCKGIHGILRNIRTGFDIVTFPILHKIGVKSAGETGGKIESFYKTQKTSYDLFRESMLAARPALMQAIPLVSGSRAVWIDCGCGTARNLEYLPVETIRSCFSKVVLLDLSPSLLEIAKERVRRMGLEDMVTIIQGDVLSDQVLKCVNETTRRVDLITFSYSLSMMPKPLKVLNWAENLVKASRGVIGIADFTVRPDWGQSKVELRTHQLWFQQDGVKLHTEIFDHVRTLTPRRLWDECSRNPVPFLGAILRPFHRVWIGRVVPLEEMDGENGSPMTSTKRISSKEITRSLSIESGNGEEFDSTDDELYDTEFEAKAKGKIPGWRKRILQLNAA